MNERGLRYMETSKNSIQGGSEPSFSEVRFTVYGDPVAKQRARTVRQKTKSGKTFVKSFTPQKTASHEENIALVYKSIYHDFKFPPDVPLRLYCDFYFPIPSKFQKKSVGKKMREAMLAGDVRPLVRNDADNCLKTVADAGNGVMYEDDGQIVEMTARKFFSDDPRTEIFLARIDNEE